MWLTLAWVVATACAAEQGTAAPPVATQLDRYQARDPRELTVPRRPVTRRDYYFQQAKLYEAPPYDLLIYHAPQPERALVSTPEEPDPASPRRLISTRYAWEGDVQPGMRLQFVQLLLPHAPMRDATPLANQIHVLVDEPGLAAVEISDGSRCEVTLLNPSGRAVGLVAITVPRSVEAAEPLLDQLAAAQAAGEQSGRDAQTNDVRDAEICCKPWYATGPFKDAEYGVFGREFDTAFHPEQDVLARGAQMAELDQVYESVPVAGATDTTRRWIVHPEWADGYYNRLPSGPPPGRNEVTYLYRTITCAAPIEVTAWLVTLDAAKVWLDGRQILNAPIREGAGQRFLRASFSMQLRAGENRLLVKIVKCFQTNGFSFAIDGLHPVHPILKHTPAIGGTAVRDVACEPYASALWQPLPAGNAQDPAWYVKRGTWREALLASRRAAAERRADLPFKSEVLRQADGPRHVRLNVSGLRQLVLLCTVGPDDYGYDDTIWADPTLATNDGRTTSLVDLKPVDVSVGFMQLFVNQNYAGQPLKIGTREFKRGLWAHAPSVLVYDLGGDYAWFETSFGLDALAVQTGSAEFVIAASRESAELAARFPDLQQQLTQLLMRDFPDRATRRAIHREMAGAITEFEQSLAELQSFRFDVEPLPTFDPAALGMVQALEGVPPTPDAMAFRARLDPVSVQAASALADYRAGRPGAAEAVINAAEAVGRFREESIGHIGPILFVRRPSFGATNAVSPFGTAGRAPARIAVFDPAQPMQPPRVIYDDATGAVWQASLSFDGTSVFFAARRANVPGEWHIYEIGTDGQNLRQITAGPGSDIAPVELPDGQIMFVSNRAGNLNVCQPNRGGAVYVCRRDGSGVRRVSANTLSDHTPAVMDDGRVMFTRWDYGVDKGVFQRHGVWTMNPDGSRLQLFFGNTVLDPNAFWQCVPVPGRPEVVSTFGGHHQGPYGVVGLLWNRLGQEAPRGEGFRFLTPEYPTYFDDNFWSGYLDPHPLNEHEFLVAYGGDRGAPSRLYLLDDRGNKTCIWEEAGELGCYNPLPVRPRARPPVIPPLSRGEESTDVDPVVAGICPDDSSQGTFLLDDVYRGLEGQIDRGEVKALQIMELVPKTRPHTGGYAWNISPLVGRGTFYVRRLIGTVPVEEDGSAHFAAPALRDISFNALDAQGRVLQKMGSTTQTMRSEQQSCIGCHEHRAHAPLAGRGQTLAAQRAPSVPQRPDWGTAGILDYCQVVQPVWDRHCVRCHSGPRPEGNLDLSGDKTRYFNMSYDMLIDRGLVHHVPQNGADQDLTTPKGNGSLASRLVVGTGRYLEPEHYGVEVSAEELQRIYTWIDANVPYYHTYLYTDGDVNGARDRWYDDLPDSWFQQEFAPVFMRRCYGCHQRTVEISDAWLGHRVVTVTSKVWTDITIMDQGLQIESSVATYGPEYRINLTHPAWSQMLATPLAPEAGGLGFCQDAEGRPVFQDTRDPDYRAMLGALEKGQRMLELNPRVDMLPRPDPAHPEAYAPSLARRRILP